MMISKLLRQKKNTRATESIETMETEITSTEPINIAVNESDTRSRKTNQLNTGDKSSYLNNTETSQNKRGTNRKKTLIVRDSTVKKY